jgi:hypothetical protein
MPDVEALWSTYLSTITEASQANKAVQAAIANGNKAQKAKARAARSEVEVRLEQSISALHAAYNDDLEAIRREMAVRCPHLMTDYLLYVAG